MDNGLRVPMGSVELATFSQTWINAADDGRGD